MNKQEELARAKAAAKMGLDNAGKNLPDELWMQSLPASTLVGMVLRNQQEIERLRAERDEALILLDNAVSDAPEPLLELGSWLADHLNDDEWPTAERLLNAAVIKCYKNS
jgi:hypothetical protein